MGNFKKIKKKLWENFKEFYVIFLKKFIDR